MFFDPFCPKVLSMCSTYKRPELAKRMILSYVEKTKNPEAKLCVYVSNKDQFVEEYKNIPTFQNVEMMFGKPRTMVEVLNYLSTEKYAKEYDFFQEVNDDHVYVTEDWDRKMASAVLAKNNGCSVAYGKTDQFPTAVMYGRKLVEELGFVFPPEYSHTFVDMWLMDVGFGANLLQYVEDVLIDHMHPGFKKGKWDDTYVQGGEETKTAKGIYDAWCESSKEQDIKKMRNAVLKHRILSNPEMLKNSIGDVVYMMTTYDRVDLAKRTFTSFSKESPGIVLHVFDDSGPHSDELVDLALGIDSVVIFRDGTHRGLEGNNFFAMKALFDAGAKVVVILDSDCIFANGWYHHVRQILKNLDFDRYLVSLFNAKVHKSMPSTVTRMVEKDTLGGLGLIITQKIWYQYLSHLNDYPSGWDGALSFSMKRNGYKLIAASPSVLDHIGNEVGRHAHVEKGGCVAEDFNAEKVPDRTVDLEALLKRYRLPNNFCPGHKMFNIPSYNQRWKKMQQEITCIKIEEGIKGAYIDKSVKEEVQENKIVLKKRDNWFPNYQQMNELNNAIGRNLKIRTTYYDKSDFKDARVLDIGCNVGQMCFQAEEWGAKRIVGVEYDKEAYKQALYIKSKRDSGVEFVLDDVDNPFFWNKISEYDITMMLSFLDTQELENRYAILAKACMKTKKVMYFEGHKPATNPWTKYMKDLITYTDFTQIEYLGLVDEGRPFFKASRTVLTEQEFCKTVMKVPYKRIGVIGQSGSGKTYLRKLLEKTNKNNRTVIDDLFVADKTFFAHDIESSIKKIESANEYVLFDYRAIEYANELDAIFYVIPEKTKIGYQQENEFQWNRSPNFKYKNTRAIYTVTVSNFDWDQFGENDEKNVHHDSCG